MAEEGSGEAGADQVVEEKAFTQADIDRVIQTRLAKEKASYEAMLEQERQDKAELEMKLQEKKASEMTDADYREALKKAHEKTQAELEELKESLQQEKQEKFVRQFDDADKQALLEAGANPKYAEILLNQLKSLRGIEGDSAFYKGKDGAVADKQAVIESIMADNAELFVVNRAKGNNIPHGEGGTVRSTAEMSTEEYIEYRNKQRAENG